MTVPPITLQADESRPLKSTLEAVKSFYLGPPIPKKRPVPDWIVSLALLLPSIMYPFILGEFAENRSIPLNIHIALSIAGTVFLSILGLSFGRCGRIDLRLQAIWMVGAKHSGKTSLIVSMLSYLQKSPNTMHDLDCVNDFWMEARTADFINDRVMRIGTDGSLPDTPLDDCDVYRVAVEAQHDTFRERWRYGKVKMALNIFDADGHMFTEVGAQGHKRSEALAQPLVKSDLIVWVIDGSQYRLNWVQCESDLSRIQSLLHELRNGTNPLQNGIGVVVVATKGDTLMNSGNLDILLNACRGVMPPTFSGSDMEKFCTTAAAVFSGRKIGTARILDVVGTSAYQSLIESNLLLSYDRTQGRVDIEGLRGLRGDTHMLLDYSEGVLRADRLFDRIVAASLKSIRS